MKHNHNHDNAPDAAPRFTPVHFEFFHPTAASVFVAGSFNQWQPKAKPLHSTGDGHWLKETALPPGSYEYCFVVDGRWMRDPLEKESIPNPFGGRNSVLTVLESAEATHLAEAESFPLKIEHNHKTI